MAYVCICVYELRTKKSPPSINELKAFENDLISLIKNIEFKKTRSKFQNKLKSDMLKIDASNELIAASDKTNNMYKMSYENYDKLLSENITQRYKKEKHQTAASIVNECKSIAKKLHIENRLRPTIDKPAFITIKDHKENVENDMKCRFRKHRQMHQCKSIYIGKIVISNQVKIKLKSQ